MVIIKMFAIFKENSKQNTATRSLVNYQYCKGVAEILESQDLQ